ncbi:hypothetical protein G8O24_12360 [Bradyrhizobium sp. INPA01-394B]|uniref:Uncharacterized protein n=1 Tax=Bradyrhizobium campsiandrae TaxID=1729892 RepID=A0ABR7UCF8_9BRAD|nr:hypothetical protein [Bradyrhizobium campsiandrae]MBC9878136.1 hypothetical protein [Bradyrhizobium campsiandrae]MBC9981588.1 hypothetical protein [Bradyrhizobium campsiandrae]
MKRTILATGAALLSMGVSAQAEPFGTVPLRRPFVDTLSNNTPLALGMDAEQATHALGQNLQYVRGRPGNEIYLALRDIGGSGLIPYRHRLFLQFRHGRLAGWKEDYGENWMWE